MARRSLYRENKYDERPDPEELLIRYHLHDLAPTADDAFGPSSTGTSETYQRGRLRVYLAAAAGAGKTYAMLNEGYRRKSRGTDVVVGYVETHQRPQTQAQIRDMEVLPRKQICYRGVTLEEMDTEAILARHPKVVLIDELAHTNAPGSKHTKRYQDVQEMLSTGIHVIATLNIQHLESLNDLVMSITGVRVRETLPDRILDQADEVELVDISPVALRQRMKHGNIYPPNRIEAALKNFFREGNLTALRELALRRTADKTAVQLQQYMEEHHIDQIWPAAERVLVGFDHRPHSRQVLRAAWRLAHSLHTDLIAVTVEPVGYAAFSARVVDFLIYRHRTQQHREKAQRHLEAHVTLAEELGAEIIRTKSSDIAHTLLEIAQERQVAHIVLGQPTRRPWEEYIRRSMINRLLRLNTAIDVHLVPPGFHYE